MDFDLIIFDCDGTLTDSENINNLALVQVLNEAGFDFTLEYGLKNWVGITVSTILLKIQMETGMTPPADIVQRYMQRVAELQLSGGLVQIEGAGDLVTAAKAKYKICVASNGERRNVIESLKIVGLMDNFVEEQVFTKIQVKNPKPFPDLFLFAADKMGADPSRCLVIEDSEAGVRAGVAAGMSVFGYAGSAHDPEKQHQHLTSAGAHKVFHSLIHMREALGL